MKLKLRTLVAIAILAVTANETSVTAAPVPVSSPLQASSSQNEWIEIGSVTLEGVGGKELRGKLYVLYLGERLLYRVFYDGVYYSVVPDSSDRRYNAKITVDGRYYWLNVPQW